MLIVATLCSLYPSLCSYTICARYTTSALLFFLPKRPAIFWNAETKTVPITPHLLPPTNAHMQILFIPKTKCPPHVVIYRHIRRRYLFQLFALHLLFLCKPVLAYGEVLKWFCIYTISYTLCPRKTSPRHHERRVVVYFKCCSVFAAPQEPFFVLLLYRSESTFVRSIWSTFKSFKWTLLFIRLEVFTTDSDRSRMMRYTHRNV